MSGQIQRAHQESQLARAAAPQTALAEAVEAGKVKMTPILAAVGIDPNNPTHQAALLACQRYELDPLLKHVVVIPRSGPYITRDGWLHIAHRSGAFDGMDVIEEAETQTHWTARVAVYRKDMHHPFTFRGRYPKQGQNKAHGPEMAVKVAEVAALRRAFPVGGVGAYEERWDQPNEIVQDFDDEPAELVEATATEPPADVDPATGEILELDGGEG